MSFISKNHQNDFGQSFDALGNRDYSLIALKKFRIFCILSTILNFGGN